MLTKLYSFDDIPFIKATFSREVAKQVYDKLGLDCYFDQFFMGMQVENEHRDVTKGDPVMTGKIAAAHLKEMGDYYTKLKKMEGD